MQNANVQFSFFILIIGDIRNECPLLLRKKENKFNKITNFEKLKENIYLSVISFSEKIKTWPK